jgi:hypothetical protein
MRQIDVRLERRLLVEHRDRLRDVDRRIADPLEVGETERQRDEMQVARRRLAQRDDVERVRRSSPPVG